jgi:dsRNA-specific ribonuclease
MTELRQINKQDFLQELKYRVENEEITEEEIIIVMRNYLLKEEEEWKKGYELAAKDKGREKEAEAWENLEDE